MSTLVLSWVPVKANVSSCPSDFRDVMLSCREAIKRLVMEAYCCHKNNISVQNMQGFRELARDIQQLSKQLTNGHVKFKS